MAQTLVDQPVEKRHAVVRGISFAARHPVRVIDAGKQAAKALQFGPSRFFGHGGQVIGGRSVAEICLTVEETLMETGRSNVTHVGFTGKGQGDSG